MDELLKFAPPADGRRGAVPAAARRPAPHPRRPGRRSPGWRARRSPPASTLLLASGLVAPAGEATSTGGRPPATFAFNPAARVVLAVDLGATHARLAVTDLGGHRARRAPTSRIAIADGPDAGARPRRRGRRSTLLGDGRPRRSPTSSSVGVGLPGPGRARHRPADQPADHAGLGRRRRARRSCRRKLRVPGAGRQRRQPHGARRAHARLARRRPPAVRQGRHRHRRRDHLRRPDPPRRPGRGRRPRAHRRPGRPGPAVPVRQHRLPRGGRQRPGDRRRAARAGIDATTSADVVALVRAGDLDASREVREAGRRHRRRCSPPA